MIIREARIADVPKLDAIAVRSKAHWGYPQELLEAWRSDLNTSPATLSSRPAFLADIAGEPVAFAQVDPSVHPWELVSMWVDPSHMGKGIGKALLRYMLSYARSFGQELLAIDSDPFAKGFYLTFGAYEVGQVPAPIPGQPDRVRPQLLLPTGAP